MKDLELMLLGFLLCHDAFWLMDKAGVRGLDKMAAYWRINATRQGWK